MNNKKTKMSTTITLFLAIIFALSLIALPTTTTAHTPPWTIPTYAYISVTPNPVGINQPVFLTFWIDKVPPTAGGTGGDRWTHYSVVVTKPDGTKQTLNLGSHSTSAAESTSYTTYTPTAVGTYTFLFSFPGQTASLFNPVNGQPGNPSDLVNDTYLPSNATATLVVQEAQVALVPDYPLPTSYWTRPIEGQNTEWASIASNYLGSPQIANLVQPDGAAPDTPHIMWTKEFGFGGVVGGSYSAASGMTYYDYNSYETQWGSALIINGRLYYALPKSTSGGMMGGAGNGYVCVDLRTGEQIYSSTSALPSFAQLYDYESMNQHGVIPNGYMWSTSGGFDFYGNYLGPITWSAYDPIDGHWLFNLTGPPSGAGGASFFGGGGTTVYGPNGEILYYNLDVMHNWLALWNNTAARGETASYYPGDTGTEAYQWRPVGNVIDASTAYSWNITIAATSPMASVLGIIPNDVMLVSANFPTAFGAIYGQIGTSNNCQVWAISLKPTTAGQLLWTKTYAAPEGNITRMLGPIDPVNRIFTMTDKETMQWLGYSIDSGDAVWGPIGNAPAFQYFGSPMFPGQSGYVYQGKLYCSGYGGVLNCWDIANGNLLWSYGNGGVGNSTNSGLDSPWGNFPIFPAGFADGKVYLYTTEHSPNAPPYKGARIRCIDATTGKEDWTLMSWSSSAFAIADGYAAYLNLYDNQVTVIGKGPSATTVEGPLTAIKLGDSLTIQGTVTDQTPSSEAKNTPAISDASMGTWMEHLYMQKPIAANTTGVPVRLEIIDPNGNYNQITTVSSDVSGTFAAMWAPQITGLYTVIATFDGSNAYYGSYAETHISVQAASATAIPTTPTPTPTATPTATPTPVVTPTITPSPVPTGPGTGLGTEYYVAIAAVVIIAIVIAVAVLLRRRK